MMRPAEAPLSILSFFAHPDDETMFLGGTLAYLAGKGAEVHFLSATRGEGGERGDPPICGQEELGGVREKELRCAVAALGGASLDFLDFADPLVGPGNELYPFSADLGAVVERLQAKLAKIQPDVILTHGPGGEYGHPGHIQAHQALMMALAEGDYQPQAVYAPAWLNRETGEFTPQPGMLVDVSGWLESKLAAVLCHRSQHDLFTRHASAIAGRRVSLPEIVRSQEALFRVLPGEGSDRTDPLGQLLSEIALPAVSR